MKRPIITLEDGTEVLETTGDVDAFAHGGGVLFREPRRRDVFWTFWDERERGEKNFLVFTAPLAPDVIEFYDPDLNEVALVTGFDIRSLRRMGRSKNPSERLQILVALRDCYGPSAIDPDHEPEMVSRHELARRWGDVFAAYPEDIPMVDYDDFIVRETSYGDYECGCVDGRYLGRHSTYKHALCAIADLMREKGLENSNVFHEHEYGDLELVAWEPETFVGKIPKRRAKLPEARWRNSMAKYVTEEIKRKGIERRTKSQRAIIKERRRKAAKHSHDAKIERARAMRRSSEEIYK